MKYYKAEFHIGCDQDLMDTSRDLLEALAGEAGFESFEDTADGCDGYVQMDLLDRLMLDEELKDFPIEGVKVEYQLSCVLDEDWNQTWEAQGFEPICISDRLLVFDARKPIPNEQYDIEIGIEAKNAFGTGTHDTTQMMLAQLLKMDLQGKRMLDCGTGTGILAIAASKLGAEDIVGYDIDEWSVKNSQHNAILNGVSNIRVLEGDSSVLSHISGVFDVIVANINRNSLIADMPKFVEVMNVGGTILLSGFYEQDIPLLLEKANELRLKETGRNHSKDWYLLELKAS